MNAEKNTVILDNEATELAKEETYEIDYNADDIFERGANYLDELAKKNFFLDAVKNYLKKYLDLFSGDVEKTEDILAFLKAAYEKSGIKGDKKKGPFSYNPSSLKEWIDGKRLPSKAETQRLALCLSMNILEATEFVFKGSLVKPFNFKEIQDSVYYFCLNTGKSFADAQRIIEEIEKSSVAPEQFPENDTLIIGEYVKNVETEEELIKYIAANKGGFGVQNQTALAVLKELLKKTAVLAEWERKNYFDDNEHFIAVNSEKDVPAILDVVLGYEARSKIGGVEVYEKKISESNFPDLIKSNFPQPQQLQDILNGKKTSVEAIRKAIILFTFYNTFAEIDKAEKEKKKSAKEIELIKSLAFDTYVDTVDEILYKSGYIQMYWKHPYDWMFGYCAGATNPLDELRLLIDEFYVDINDMYSEGSRDYNE